MRLAILGSAFLYPLGTGFATYVSTEDFSLCAGGASIEARNLSVTAARTDLGHIAGKEPQRRFYASLWSGI